MAIDSLDMIVTRENLRGLHTFITHIIGVHISYQENCIGTSGMELNG